MIVLLIPCDINLSLLTDTTQLMASVPGTHCPCHLAPVCQPFTSLQVTTCSRPRTLTQVIALDSVSSWRDKEDEVPLIILAHFKEMTLLPNLLIATCVLGIVSPNYGKNDNKNRCLMLLL